jgi:transposase
MMHRGYSRDHRPDCLQVVLAVIVNIDGFPLSYETFDGNRADVTTLETVMRMVERTYGQARRVWVFDRGIVSDANLAAIRRRGGQYLVGTRRTTLRHVERALLEGPWGMHPRGDRLRFTLHLSRSWRDILELGPSLR